MGCEALTPSLQADTLEGCRSNGGAVEGRGGNASFYPLTMPDNLSSFNEFTADRVRRKLEKRGLTNQQRPFRLKDYATGRVKPAGTP